MRFDVRKSFDWIARARLMNPYDTMCLGVISGSSVRESLERIKSDPDPAIAKKRYKVKTVPFQGDRKTLKAIKANKIKESDAVIKYPKGIVFICCKSWHDMRGFPRKPRPKPDLLLTGRHVSSPSRGYQVAQSMPDYDETQVPPSWDD